MAGCLVFQPNKSQKLDEDQALHPGDEADIQCKPPLAFPKADTKAERMNFCSKNDHAKKKKSQIVRLLDRNLKELRPGDLYSKL